MNNWIYLQSPIKELLATKANAKEWKDVEPYLKAAYEKTEAWYKDALNRLDTVRLVIFGEAPLFGPDCNYIYNPQTPLSSFLWLEDLTQLCSEQQTVESTKDKKLRTLELMSHLGILIVDTQPYALNKKDVGLSYPNLTTKEQKNLLDQSMPYFLEKKLTEIKNRQSHIPNFVYRYKSTDRMLGKQIAPTTQKIFKREVSVSCIGGSNMPLDRAKLKQYYHS